MMIVFLFFLVCWQTFYTSYLHSHSYGPCGVNVWIPFVSPVWHTAKTSRERERDLSYLSPWSVSFVSYNSSDVMRDGSQGHRLWAWTSVWMCTEIFVHNTGNTHILLSWGAMKSKIKQSTAPFTKQSDDCIYTHTTHEKRNTAAFPPLFFFL